MPELPEVETIVRSLRPQLTGRTVRAIWTSGLPLRLARPLDAQALGRACRGGRIAAVERRGKYILLELQVAKNRHAVLVHLGMSGRLRLQAASEPRDKHTHVVWGLEDDRELRFVDARRFGLVKAAAGPEALEELAALGPDPLLELDATALACALVTSRAPIKTFLLDQRRVAGLGNIYVCEALFRAGLHPSTPARRAARRAHILMGAIREALEVGIANRGTTLRDYVDSDGGVGGNQAALRVYGRAGLPCLTCGSTVRRTLHALRSTFYCPSCQKR